MKWLAYVVLSCIVFTCSAQNSESSFEDQLAQLELEMDSLSIFNFLDSIIMSTPLKSEIGIRIGYTSSRLAAGRDFNTEQRGFSPGISYYHKSGAYADFTSFFDNQSDEALTQSQLHMGYLWLPSNKWTINPYAEKTFNHQDLEFDLTQSLGTSLGYDFKITEATLDYSFLWGRKSGHRLIASLNKSITIKKVPLIETLTLYPSFSTNIGTTNIFSYLYSSLQLSLLEIQDLTNDEIRSFRIKGKITTKEAFQLRIARNLLNEGTDMDREFVIDLINNTSLRTVEEGDTFALLNYSFSLPISFKVGPKTSMLLSYSYSIPIKLPGEDLGVDPTGFFSFSLSQRITW